MNQKKLLENTSELRNILIRLFEENGLDKTLTITGLSVFELFDKMEPIVINSDLSFDLLYHIFTKYKNKLTKEIGYYELNFNFDGVMEWEYRNDKDKEYMYSLCTPYWDGNALTPIESEHYSNNNFEFNSEGDKEYYASFKCPQQFNNLHSLIYWYENKYLPTVYNKLNEFLNEFREKTID